MSYHPRVSMEEPLKNSQKVNKLQIPNSSYLKSFKKAVGSTSINKSKVEVSQRSFGSDENGRSIKAREKPLEAEKNRSKLQQLQSMMQETDNSMEELLNSSINQFQKLIIHEDSGESLEEQNYRLKNALSIMKNILKDKLENALQKQKQQLSKMLEDYISLITKLLQDKQELTIKIQDMIEDNQRKAKQSEYDWTQKLRMLTEERDQHIGTAKNQIEQFLTVIEQYQEQAKQDQNKYNQMQQRIEELEEEREYLVGQLNGQDKSDSGSKSQQELNNRVEAQSSKIQALLELLQKSQTENSQLKAQINQLITRQANVSQSHQIKQVKQSYERRIQKIEQEHEEQFLEYEKAIKDTLLKKDQCIDRLNLIIEGLRERKAVH